MPKEEIKKKQDENYEKWKKEIDQLVDNPDIDFKGNFIKKHLSKLFGDDIITMSGKTIIVDKGEALIEEPYVEIKPREGLDEKKKRIFEKSFKKAFQCYEKVIEEFPSVAKGVS